jgi:formylglycine-generating enzyme required for sulfatase activity
MPTKVAAGNLPLCGRADLVRLRDAGPLAELAGLLGYRWEPLELPTRPLAATLATMIAQDDAKAGAAPRPQPEIHEKDMPFWAVQAYQCEPSQFADDDGSVPEPELPDAAPLDLGPQHPDQAPLGSFAALLPSLRGAAAVPRPSRMPDVRALLHRLGRGVVLDAVPRRARRRWGSSVVLIEDHSTRLLPYRADYDRVTLHQLPRLYPLERLPAEIWAGPAQTPYPAPGTIVLALTDLGTLMRSPDHTRIMAGWRAYGAALRRRRCLPVAILPAAPLHSLASLRGQWRIASWERQDVLTEAEQDEALERLLNLAALAVTIQPGLLRALRLVLAGEGARPGVEALFWQSDRLVGRHPAGAMFADASRSAGRAAFAALPAARRREALACLMRWRGQGLEALWHWEIAGLDAETQALLPETVLNSTAAAFQRLGKDLAEPEWARPGTASLFLRMDRRIDFDELNRPAAQDQSANLVASRRAVVTGYTRGWVGVHQDDAQTPPPGLDLSLLGRSTEKLRRMMIRHSQGGLAASWGNQDRDSGSPLAELRARRDLVLVEPDSFWKTGIPPAFAEEWGCDTIGPWVTFTVTGADGAVVTQRLRWIPAGTFLMGSPEGEAERFGNEGPQHRVTISRGFWLFDTACTQALWTAVMGRNPSYFQGADRPVETVSWVDCQDFIARVNELKPGIDLRLPSEAEWEYACRAGTETPFSFSPTITPEQANYNGNYPYAPGRKGLYRKETVPVGSLPANRWGLYEMHGNVDEWCVDGMRDYRPDPLTDPLGPLETGALRALRGGSWFDVARGLRSAGRRADDLGLRGSNVGFRCARVQEGAEPSETRRIRQAERRIAADRSGGAGVQRLRASSQLHEVVLPKGPFILRSDCETLTLAPMTQPSWASAIGRDRYGLWTEFTIPDLEDAPVLQRMRWIAPGRFLMGSPETEAGRSRDEGPQHWATISRGFWLADTACTQALWQAVMGDNPSEFKGDPMRPVEQVSWDMAQSFMREIEDKVPGLGLSLPTEAQWEYACRAGTETAYSFGAAITGELARFYGPQSKNLGTVPVGSLPPNPWGLFEMHGNVWEWCADGRREYGPDPVTDPLGPLETRAERALRGGSWGSGARDLRSAGRSAGDQGLRGSGVGFRCARVQEGAEPGGDAANPAGGAPERSGAAGRSGGPRKRRKK